METDFQESSSTSVNRLPRYRPTGVRRRSTSPRSKVHVGDRVQAGIQFEADHVFYLYVSNNRFYGRLYPDVPRPVVELVDFQEVF